jgi:di/tripeptidase
MRDSTTCWASRAAAREAKLSYIIRDHARRKFEDRKDFIEDIARR